MLTREDEEEKVFMLKRIKGLLPLLTPLQRMTLKKLYFCHMTQAEIARDEGVSEPVISKRVARIYARLQKKLKKS